MNNVTITVGVRYRNYIPLYSGYCSFWLSPIKNVEVIIPKVKRNKILFRIYRLLRGLPLFSSFVYLGQKIFFRESFNTNNEDMFFYAGMLPRRELNMPYVVDFEHIYSLFDYSIVNNITKDKVWRSLSSKNCVGILPWSEAALNTLKLLYEEKYLEIESKVLLIYPALPKYSQLYKGKEDYELISRSMVIKFLFVGRDCKRKGLIELLTAFLLLSKECKNVELCVVSDIDEETKRKYKKPGIFFWEAKFSHEEILKKFFLTCDIFVMPTHADTFGMVLLEALSCGLPVITTNQFASKEIVEDGINGLFVNSNNLFLDKMLIPDKKHTGNDYNEVEKILVEDIFKKIKYLINNPKKIIKMKKNATKQFEEGGKFSISERNKKLKFVYEKIN